MTERAVAALLEDQGALGLEGIPLALLLEPTTTASPVAAQVASAPRPTAVQSAAPAPAVPAPARPQAVAQQSALPPAAQLVRGGSLEEVRAELGDCTRCKLHATRKNIVFGVGDPKAKLVFVGEGPGADEDAQGEPFVGKAGQLLTKMIEAMGLSRNDVYICNIVKCRPPNNRDPEPDEVASCEPFLIKQLGAVSPQVIVALGKHAAHTLLRETTPITAMRGKWKEYAGIKLMPTFHPAYLLRNPAEKRAAWTDLKEVMRVLGM